MLGKLEVMMVTILLVGIDSFLMLVVGVYPDPWIVEEVPHPS